MSGFEHVCRNGCIVKCATLNLSMPLEVHISTDATHLDVARAVAEAVGHHGAAVWPDLPAFRGYDSLDIRIVVQPMLRVSGR